MFLVAARTRLASFVNAAPAAHVTNCVTSASRRTTAAGNASSSFSKHPRHPRRSLSTANASAAPLVPSAAATEMEASSGAASGATSGAASGATSSAASSSEDMGSASVTKPFAEIPGPATYPIVGSLLGLHPFSDLKIQRYFHFMHQLFERFGHIAKVEIPAMPPMVFLFHPEDVESVFRADGKFPRRHAAFGGMEFLHQSRVNQGLFGSLATIDGPDWWHYRAPLNPKMMKPDSAHPYMDKQCQVADEFVGWIKRHRDASSFFLPHEFVFLLNKFALEAISSALFDAELGFFRSRVDDALGEDRDNEEALEFIKNLQSFFESTSTLAQSPPTWKFYKNKMFKEFMNTDKFINKYMTKKIEECMQREQGKSVNIVQQLLRNTDNSLEENASILVDILNGGVDSTASSASWLLYNLARNQDVQDKLRAEIYDISGGGAGSGGNVDEDASSFNSISARQMNGMVYLNAVVKESFRLTPSVSTTARVLKKDLVLRGYHIPAGMMCNLASSISATYDEFIPDASSFKPERWLRPSRSITTTQEGNQLQQCPQQSQDRGQSQPPLPPPSPHPFSTIPFGYGTRMCIGRRLAEQELRIIVVKLLQHFRICYEGDDLDIRFAIFNVPDKPVHFHFHDI